MIVHSSCLNNTIRVVTDNRSVAELALMPIEGISGKVYFFNRIKVLEPFEGTGEGRELMIEVCRYADQMDATIYNPLNPYGKRNMKSLVRFFKSSGFEIYGDPKHHTMIRRPRTGPYLIEEKITIVRKYNPKYGDQRVCKCGHPYDRHFDGYDDMAPVGCKYCDCYEFVEKETHG